MHERVQKLQNIFENRSMNFINEPIYLINEGEAYSVINNSKASEHISLEQIVVFTTRNAMLKDSAIAQLNKILKAVDSAPERTLIFDFEHQKVLFKQLTRMNTPERILLFGMDPLQVGLQTFFERYRPYKFMGKTLLFADDLGSISADKNLKNKLWTALKEIYNIQ